MLGRARVEELPFWERNFPDFSNCFDRENHEGEKHYRQDCSPNTLVETVKFILPGVEKMGLLKNLSICKKMNNKASSVFHRANAEQQPRRRSAMQLSEASLQARETSRLKLTQQSNYSQAKTCILFALIVRKPPMEDFWLIHNILSR